MYKYLPLILLTSACTTQNMAMQGDYPQSIIDNGVTIAETKLTGPSGGLTTSGLLDDCAGPGLGVQVQGTSKTGEYLFDANGNPCTSAQEIFNGHHAVNQRPTDATSIQIGFQDKFGAVPPHNAGTSLTPIHSQVTVTTNSTLPEDFATAPTGSTPDLTPHNHASPKAPQLGETVTQWQTERERQRMAAERQVVMEKSAQTLASMRELDRMTSRELIQAQHEKMLDLIARLRDMERQLDSEQQRHHATLDAADNARLSKEQVQQKWTQRETALEAEKQALQGRLAAFEHLSQRLSTEKREQQTAYAQRVATLENELSTAEQHASKVRQELVLEAAQKIAEAERIAHAARLSEQQAKMQEAKRLQAESNELYTRATALTAGKSIVVPRMADMFDKLSAEPASGPRATFMPLEDVPIAINVKDKPLNKIVAEIFSTVQNVSGNWKVDWQLSGKAQYLLEETWTLTAETRFQDLMAHIQKTVKEQNNITLNFRRFENSRLFVISDE